MDADWQKEREKAFDKLLDSMLDSDTKSLDEFVKKQEELAEKFTSIYEGSMSYDQKLDSINRKYTDSIKVMTDVGMLDNVNELKKEWYRDWETSQTNQRQLTKENPTTPTQTKRTSRSETSQTNQHQLTKENQHTNTNNKAQQHQQQSQNNNRIS